MSAVTVAIWSLVAAAGAALAGSAPFGAAGHGGQYLVGHVILGLGLGQLLAAAVRLAARRLISASAPGTVPVRLAAVPAAQAATPAAAAQAVNGTAVTILYPRPSAVVPLRGRHAA